MNKNWPYLVVGILSAMAMGVFLADATLRLAQSRVIFNLQGWEAIPVWVSLSTAFFAAMQKKVLVLSNSLVWITLAIIGWLTAYAYLPDWEMIRLLQRLSIINFLLAAVGCLTYFAPTDE